MNHSSHWVCPNIYRKALEEGTEKYMDCCQCKPHDNCGDDQGKAWIDQQLKRIKEEQQTIKYQARIDQEAGEDGFLPD